MVQTIVLNIKDGLVVTGSVATKLSGQGLAKSPKETIIDISSPGEVNVIITDPTQKVIKKYKLRCFCTNCGANEIFVELPVGTAFAKPKYAGNIEIDVASYNICPKCRCKSFLMPAAQK